MGVEDLDRVLLASDGRGRVHLAADQVRTECGRRLGGFPVVEWGTRERVTCRTCRRKLDGGR